MKCSLYCGDNLLVLKELTDKVDMIYIDPPYGTNHTENFRYEDKNDSFTELLKRLETSLNQFPNANIAISIDSENYVMLKLLCDKLFKNYPIKETFYWKTRGLGGQVRGGALIDQMEMILVYAFNLNRIERESIEYKWTNFRKTGGDWKRTARPKQYYPFYFKDNTLSLDPIENSIEIFPLDSKNNEGFWRHCKETAAQNLNRIRARFVKGKYIVEIQDVYTHYNQGNFVNDNISEDISSTGASLYLKNLGFNFNNPKPVNLIKYLIQLLSKNGDTILDYYAGSGTTGEAAIVLGNRDVILVTNNENNIFKDVLLPRIQRVQNNCNTVALFTV